MAESNMIIEGSVDTIIIAKGQHIVAGTNITTGRASQADNHKKSTFRMLLIGGMGCGKSTLTKAFCGNNSAVAGYNDDTGLGVTRDVRAHRVKDSICRKLKLGNAFIIDAPGTGDPSMSIMKIIAKIEANISTKEIHAILLMNEARHCRLTMDLEIATILLKKSFIKSADQIIAVMTKCDDCNPRTLKKNENIWEKRLKREFGDAVDIPIVKCGIPVEYEDPYNVIESKMGENPYNIVDTLNELARLAEDPKIVQYVQADTEILRKVAKIMGVPIEDMEEEIKKLKAAREEALRES